MKTSVFAGLTPLLLSAGTAQATVVAIGDNNITDLLATGTKEGTFFAGLLGPGRSVGVFEKPPPPKRRSAVPLTMAPGRSDRGLLTKRRGPQDQGSAAI